MTKNKYLNISSIIQIVLSLISFLFLDKYVTSTIDSYKNLYEVTNNKSILDSIALYESSGTYILSAFLIGTILINLIIIYHIYHQKENSNYTLLLFLSIGIFLINDSMLSSWLSVVNIFVCAKGIKSKKRLEKTKADKVIKAKLPNYNLLDKLLALGSIVAFLWLSKLIGLLPWGYMTLSIILDVILFIICLFVFWKELVIGVKLIKKHFKKFMSYVINHQFKMLSLYLIVSVVIMMIMGGDSQSVNQKLAESMPLLFIIPSSILYAPFVEELIFRCSLRRFIKNDWLFIVVSGLFFGILHTLYEASLFRVIILAIPYATLGSYLAYLYVKTNNILTPISCHLIHNTIACIALLFL